MTPTASDAPSGLWRGPTVISVGLAVLGLSSYLYLSTAARTLPTEEYAAVAALWSLVYFLLAGVFAPLEIEGTRAVSMEVSQGRSASGAVRRLASVGTAWTLVLLLILLVMHRPIASVWFDGDSGYVFIAGATGIAFAIVYVGRGYLAGSGRFTVYSAILAGEGVLRALVVVVIAFAGWGSGLGVAATIALAAAMAAIATLLVLREAFSRASSVDHSHGQASGKSHAGTAKDLFALLIASVAAQGLINAGPLTVQAVGDDPALTGAVLAVFVLVRVPVMFISALQSGFIPSLVGVLSDGDLGRFDRLVVLVLSRVAAAGALLTAGAAACGPWITQLLFGSEYVLQGIDYALLMFSSVVFVFSALLQAVLVSLQRQRVIAVGWILGMLTYGACLLLPLTLLRRVEVGSVMSMVVVCVCLWAGIHLAQVRRRVGSRSGRIGGFVKRARKTR